MLESESIVKWQALSCLFLLPSKIDLDHSFICLHLIHSAFAQEMTLVEYSDRAGNLTNENHIVLNDDDAVPPGQAHQEFAGLVRFLVGHAGGGFIDKQE